MDNKERILQYIQNQIASNMPSFKPNKKYDIRKAGNLIKERTEDILHTLEDEGYIGSTHKSSVMYDKKNEAMYVDLEVRPITSIDHCTLTFNKEQLGMNDEQFTRFCEGLKEEIENLANEKYNEETD